MIVKKNKQTCQNVITIIIGIIPIPTLVIYQIIAEKFIFPHYSEAHFGYLLIEIGAFVIGGAILVCCRGKVKLWCIPGILVGIIAVLAYIIAIGLREFQF